MIPFPGCSPVRLVGYSRVPLRTVAEAPPYRPPHAGEGREGQRPLRPRLTMRWGLPLRRAPHARVDQCGYRLSGSGGPVLVFRHPRFLFDHALQQILGDRRRKPEETPNRCYDLVRQTELCGNDRLHLFGMLPDRQRGADDRTQEVRESCTLGGISQDRRGRIQIEPLPVVRSLQDQASRPMALADCSAAGSQIETASTSPRASAAGISGGVMPTTVTSGSESPTLCSVFTI